VYFSALLATIATMVAPPPALATGAIHPDTACAARNVPVPGRKSPLGSVTFTIANQAVKVCYGRPAGAAGSLLALHRAGRD